MKKTIGTYFCQYFKMPHLYREDLQAIEKLMHGTLKPKRYLLACEGLEFDRLEEVSDTFDQAHVLVISTQQPSMRLKFARSWAELYTGDDNPDVENVFHQVAKIVSKGERRCLWSLFKYSPWLAPLVGFGSLTIALGLIALGVIEVRSIFLVAWLLLLASVWWGFGHRLLLHSFSRLDFQLSRGRDSFLERHRERLVLFLAGLVFGGVTAVLLINYCR